MHSPAPRFSWLASLRTAGLLLALTAFFAACDRHSAEEVPESYGHGSSHAKSYSDHQVDSRDQSSSFSDTHGVDAGAAPRASVPAATPVPTPVSATTKFFQ